MKYPGSVSGNPHHHQHPHHAHQQHNHQQQQQQQPHQLQSTPLPPPPGSTRLAHQSTAFVEQVSTVTGLFDQWNDCERTVVLYALLKRLPFSNLKFLQLSIEYNIAQNINLNVLTTGGQNNNNNHLPHHQNGTSQFNKYHLLESNSNNGVFLSKLISVYKNFTPPVGHGVGGGSGGASVITNDDQQQHHHHHQPHGAGKMAMTGAGAGGGGDNGVSRTSSVIYGIGATVYETKEDILQDVLTYLPLLKPGNDEAKSAYISLIPIVVADSIKQIVPTDIVQQILSYLLIHPAVTSEDRRSLAHWLHHLEEHIHSTFIDGSNVNATPVTSTPTTTATSTANKGRAVPCKLNQATTAFGIINEATLNWNDPNQQQQQHHHLQQQQQHLHQQQQHQKQLQQTQSIAANKYNGNKRSASGGPFTMPSYCIDGTPMATSPSGAMAMRRNSDRPQSQMVWPPLVGGSNVELATATPKTTSQEYVCDERIIKEFRKTIGNPILKSAVSSTVSSLTSCSSAPSSTSSSSSASSSSSSSSISGGAPKVANNNNIPVATKGIYETAMVQAEQAPASPSAEEDHHISFSKNGTEIPDFFCDDNNKSNTQIAFETPPPPIRPQQLTDYLTVPTAGHLADNCFCGSTNPSSHCQQMMMLKTRRSNSLTTAAVTIPQQVASSSSTENLMQLKPRSYSLSIEGQRGASLMSHGSETRLDALKPNNFLKVGGGNPGMNCIGQWLKSLRLHKYVWLFSNITYEQMLEITEEYLDNLSVTKGARHKLVLCIQKLKERYTILSQMESQLAGPGPPPALAPIMDELTNIVLTPMKPADPFSKEDIAGLFIKVIEMVASLLITRSQPLAQGQSQGAADEECVTGFLWIMERALHNEAFLSHLTLLKDIKFKVSKIKMQFVNKPHFSKAMPPGSLNKTRWVAPVKKHPSATGNQNGTNSGMTGIGGVVSAAPAAVPGALDTNKRKNSNSSQLANYNAMVQQLQQFKLENGNAAAAAKVATDTDVKHHYFNSTANNVNKMGPPAAQMQYNKSSSYPSFSQHLKMTAHPHMSQPPPSLLKPQNQQQPQQRSNANNNPMYSNKMPPNMLQQTHHPQQQAQPQSHMMLNAGTNQNNNSNNNYHRHSLNSLMTNNGSLASMLANTGNGSPIISHLTSPGGPHGPSLVVNNGSGGGCIMGEKKGDNCIENNENIDIGNQCSDKSSIGDINSRLEFLCLQMTEQAIN